MVRSFLLQTLLQQKHKNNTKNFFKFFVCIWNFCVHGFRKILIFIFDKPFFINAIYLAQTISIFLKFPSYVGKLLVSKKADEHNLCTVFSTFLISQNASAIIINQLNPILLDMLTVISFVLFYLSI